MLQLFLVFVDLTGRPLSIEELVIHVPVEQVQTRAMLCRTVLHVLLGLQDRAVLHISLAMGYPQLANSNGRA